MLAPHLRAVGDALSQATRLRTRVRKPTERPASYWRSGIDAATGRRVRLAVKPPAELLAEFGARRVAGGDPVTAGRLLRHASV